MEPICGQTSDCQQKERHKQRGRLTAEPTWEISASPVSAAYHSPQKGVFYSEKKAKKGILSTNKKRLK